MPELLNTISPSSSGLLPWLTEWGPSVLVFLIATAAFLAIARIYRRRPNDEEIRLQKITPSDPLGPEPGEGVFGPLTPALAVQIPETEKERRDFHVLLRQAGLYSPSARATIYALRFVLMVAPLIAAGVWVVATNTEHPWRVVLAGLFAAAVLSVIPRLYVFFRRRARVQRIRQGLPDTIDMLSMCTSGGLGLSESLEHVAGQLTSYPELAQELMILRRQAEVGSLKQALADLCARVDLPEVRQMAGLLTRGTRLGTRLAGSLNEQADHLRTARRQAATTQANKTPVKLVFPVLFCFAPAALILLTAPALLQLKDFVAPSAQMSTASEAGRGFGTGAVIDALRGLEQAPPSPFIPGSASPGERP